MVEKIFLNMGSKEKKTAFLAKNSLGSLFLISLLSHSQRGGCLRPELVLPVCLLLKSQLYLGGWWMCFRGSFHESLKLCKSLCRSAYLFFFESIAFFWFSNKVENYWPGVKYRSGDEASPSSRGRWLPHSLTSLTLQHWLSRDGRGGLPGGAVVKNPPANAGHVSLSPGPGRSHILWSN